MTEEADSPEQDSGVSSVSDCRLEGGRPHHTRLVICSLVATETITAQSGAGRFDDIQRGDR